MPFSLSRFYKTFTFSWFMFIFMLFGVGLFVFLGFWQIERGFEKRDMLADFSAKARRAPLLWNAGAKSPDQFQKILVKGHFLPKVFLLDNQYRKHKFGYDYIQPLLLENGKVVLIDRGWFISQSFGSRHDLSLPRVEILRVGSEEIEGTVYYPSRKSFVLGKPYEKISKNVILIETQDKVLFSKFLHKSVYPFIIRETVNSNTLLQEWPVVAMSPSRHYAYALQWFGLAITSIIIGIVLKRRNA
jgi:surfeit locus 1 family protein